MATPTIDIVQVKVMRSYDYCHFEVALLSTTANTIEATDELRKVAARLADKAVAQYRIAKANAARLLGEKNERAYLMQRIKSIRDMPEGERTVSAQAELKAFDDAEAFDDAAWEASHGYDYEDDWDDDQDS
jgi:hypothetical protein